uniref:Syndecan n=1 Tax=Cacopsylla melanoneura TaxID=428564 RepID=A0A8D8ZTR6_9HEMI
MQRRMRICFFLFSIQLLVINVDAKSNKPSSATSTTTTLKPSSSTDEVQDIYIDDESRIEGSGISNVKDDLESSGSGFGPDDEDGDGAGAPKNSQGNKGTKTHALDVEDRTTPKSSYPDPDNVPEVKHTDVSSSEQDHSISNVDTKSPDQSSPGLGSDVGSGNSASGKQDVVVVGSPDENKTSFFAQPGILAAVIGGAVVGLLCAILVVMFIVYRMRKKDEGSYALEEPKRSPASNSYMKNSNREFYA